VPGPIRAKKKARSPLYSNGTFTFVSFPEDGGVQIYPVPIRKFVREHSSFRTHLDPDWKNLTYGDKCWNRRGSALRGAAPGDIFLFWGLLWRMPNDGAQNVFQVKNKGWYLFGAFRIQSVLEPGTVLADSGLRVRDQKRIAHNAHVVGNRVEPKSEKRHSYVFVGDQKYSAKFSCAVDLGVGCQNSLLQHIVRTADGRQIQWSCAPQWNSVTRTCRAILYLSKSQDAQKAWDLRKAIRRVNKDYDLLESFSKRI